MTTDLLAPSGKLPFPGDLVPKGMTPASYGNTIWGAGPAEATALMGARSADELRAIGLAPASAARWQDFYANVARLNPRNPSAQPRVELLQDVINTLGGG